MGPVYPFHWDNVKYNLSSWLTGRFILGFNPLTTLSIIPYHLLNEDPRTSSPWVDPSHGMTGGKSSVLNGHDSGT